MFFETLLFITLTILFVFLLNCNIVYVRHRWSALSPFNFYIFLNVIIFLDFYFFYYQRDTSFLEQSFYITDDDFFLGFYFFIYSYVMLTFGMIVYLLGRNKNKRQEVIIYDHEFNASTKRLYRNQFVGISIISLIILASNFGAVISMIAGDITKQNLFRDELGLLFLFTFLPYSAALAISATEKLRNRILIILVSSALMIFTDSRGGVIYMFLLLFYAYNEKNKKINLISYFIALPLVGYLLTVLRYVFRESWRYSSMSDFIDDKGGYFQLFFNSVEISMAEVISTAIKFSTYISRFPLESIWAGVVFPIPRSIYESKPVGGSSAFTSIMSPDKWFYTKSEIVVTGYGDLYLNLGFLFSGILLFFVGVFWAYLIVKNVNKGVQNNIYILPVLMWLMYTFLRADIFNMMRWLWAFVIFNLIIY
ncbi:TPA: oligosaccharide repeat unit polymerase, partial [Klebsiella quasipneumoniae subsp. similipneumoniae]|nr:oligosaccharide repeat unit polymerase [Klebsiella quasipneumoniae subsp. similipneumoniae]